MENDNTRQSQEYRDMAEAASAVLDTKFLKALSDPTRVLILKKLINVGACDISTIAQGLSQDRSVISRHLATLERAGICASTKQGRHVLYDLDGPYIVAKVESILEVIAPMAEMCQPFSDIPHSGAA